MSEEDEGEEHAHGDAHEDGHNHGDVNAHAWMSIALYKQQVENILEGLCRIDLKHQDAYESNAKEYLAKLEDLEREQQSLKEELAGKHIVIFHEAYAYVAEDYDMEISYTMDLDEERQVSAGEVADVMEAIEKNDISVVLAEELYGKDMGDTVERETDAKVCYLDTLTRGEYEKDSYLDAMRHNMELLEGGFCRMRKIVKPCGLHCIRINHLGVTIGEQQILSDVNLHIHCGTLTVLIGRNGAGKSTLIRLF